MMSKKNNNNAELLHSYVFTLQYQIKTIDG